MFNPFLHNLRADHQRTNVNFDCNNFWNIATFQTRTHRPTWPRRPAKMFSQMIPLRSRWWLLPQGDRGVDRSLKTTTTHQTRLRWTQPASAKPTTNLRKSNPFPPRPTSYGADFHWVSVSFKPPPPPLRKISTKRSKLLCAWILTQFFSTRLF